MGSSGTSRDSRIQISAAIWGAHEPLLEAYFPELEYPESTLAHFYYERLIEFAGTESRTKDKKEVRGKWPDSGWRIQRRLDELRNFERGRVSQYQGPSTERDYVEEEEEEVSFCQN